MKPLTKFLIVAPIVFLMVVPAVALDDTMANRAAQADNYMRAVPPQALMKELAGKLAATLPESQRAAFTVMMTRNLDIKVLADVMRVSMIKNFTADELKALADFSHGFTLGPLAREAIADLFRSVFGDVPNLGLLADRIYEVSGGNPRLSMHLAQVLVGQQV